MVSDVVILGSVDKALSGKVYNRSVRVYKLVDEVLYRYLLNKMEDSNIGNFELSAIISEKEIKVHGFSEDIS